MSYGVLIPVATAATNIDAWNRSCISGVNFTNGALCSLLSKSTNTNESELWEAAVPATADLTNDWMVYDPELVWTNNYRGLDPDVRNYYITAGRTFSAFYPHSHDLVLMSADCFTGAIGANTFANATNGQSLLVWGSTQSSSCVSLGLVATQYISFGTGALDTQRVTAYLLEILVQK